MILTPEMIQTLIVQLLTAGAIYGGIRADVKNMHERVMNLEKRFNYHVERRGHVERKDDENA